MVRVASRDRAHALSRIPRQVPDEMASTAALGAHRAKRVAIRRRRKRFELSNLRTPGNRRTLQVGASSRPKAPASRCSMASLDRMFMGR